MAEYGPPFGWEERIFKFSIGVRRPVDDHEWINSQWRNIAQPLRSSGAVAANYAAANHAFSKRDFAHRIGVARKDPVEARKSLRTIDHEADKWVRIFSKIHKSSF